MKSMEYMRKGAKEGTELQEKIAKRKCKMLGKAENKEYSKGKAT
jgi:hypothetical protein